MKFTGLIEQREKTLSQIDREHGSQSLELAPVLESLGYMYHALGRHPEARDAYERALSVRILAGQNDTEQVLTSLHALGLLFRLEQQFESAEVYYRRALDVSSKVYGPSHPETCKRQNYLAGLYYALCRYADAQALITASIDAYRSTAEETRVAQVLCLLALTLIAFRSDQTVEAEELLESSSLLLQTCPEQTVAGDDITDDLMQFILIQLRQRSFDDAEAIFRYVIIGETKGLWPRHPSMAKNLKHLGDLHAAFNRPERAATIYRQSLVMYMDSIGSADPDIADLADALAKCLIATGRTEEAVQPQRISQEMRALLSKRLEVG